jgi:Xaa-Pro dipeptidase
MLSPDNLPAIQSALADARVDGWLLFDFRGTNPIAGGLLGFEGLLSRRAFAWVPTSGTPVAITHAIEQGPWKHWPKEWTREVYSSWRTLEETLASTVGGKRVAMEYSPGDAVPYLDRIPAGVIEMVRATRAEVVSSGELVSRFYAVWTESDIAAHDRAAEAIAQVARDAFTFAAARARGDGGAPLAEHELAEWIRKRFTDAGLETDHGPNVSAGANAANPHYEPSEASPVTITDGQIVLIDLWAKERGKTVPYADQTWMASLGAPSAEATKIWTVVRDARDAAISMVTTSVGRGEAIRGADVDDAARAVIRDAGYGQYFTHRTGHSIDSRELHGSGPNLDNLESREERLLIPGVAFSIEPGIYIPGRIGMRSEVNVYIAGGKAVVTPRKYQQDLLVV